MTKSIKLPVAKIRNALQHLSFADLTLFEAMARNESLGAAARELDLRAPFVTKALNRIEKLLGLQLLKRGPQGAVLTPDGVRFLKVCQSLSHAIDHCGWIDSSNREEPVKILTVLGPTFLLAHLVGPHAQKPMRQLSFGLRLIDLGTEEINSGFYREHFEAAVHCDRIALGAAWKTYPLGTASWVLCARKDHPLGTRVTEKEVLGFPFVLPALVSRQGFRVGEDHCPVPAAQRLRLSEARSGELALPIVENTDQLIFLPELQARARIQERKLRIIHVTDWSLVRKTVYLTVHQDRMKQKHVQALVRALESGLGQSVT